MKISHRLTDKKFVVVCFYTLDEIYSKEVQRLKKSIDLFNLDYYMEGVTPLGSWKQATDYKANFIKRALNRTDVPLVFVDADGEFVKYPDLFDTLTCDLAAFINHINNLLSGTLYFGNNEKVKDFVDRWIKYNKNTVLFEQSILQSEIRKSKNFKFDKLPIGYCQIHNYKFRDNNPVIIHWQASRRTKKLLQPISKEKYLTLINTLELESNKIWEKKDG